MNICWAIASGYNSNSTVDTEILKSIGSIWGSWTTHSCFFTDNIICHDLSKARELVSQNFHNHANFFVHKNHYDVLGCPENIKLYAGEYHETVNGIDDIVALHLASAGNDIVLLLGFDFEKIRWPDDKRTKEILTNRHGLIRSAIAQNDQTQWVAVDHPSNLDKIYQSLPNLSCDTMSNVLKLLAQ